MCYNISTQKIQLGGDRNDEDLYFIGCHMYRLRNAELTAILGYLCTSAFGCVFLFVKGLLHNSGINRTFMHPKGCFCFLWKAAVKIKVIT